MARHLWHKIAVIAAMLVLALAMSPKAKAYWGSTLKGGCPYSIGANINNLCATPQDVCEYWGRFYGGGCLGFRGPNIGSGKIVGWKYDVLYGAGGGTVIHLITLPVCDPASEKTDSLSPSGCSKFVPPPAKQLGQPPCNAGGGAFVGNPISAAIGNKVEISTDYESAGPDKLAFIRTYNSQGQVQSFLGVRWQSNFDRAILKDTSSIVYVLRPDGRQLRFTKSGGVWSSGNTDVDGSLVTDGTTLWTYSDADDTVETFDFTSGRLLSIRTRSGYEQVLAYDGNGMLASVTDSYGRQLNFVVTDGALRTLTDPDGKIISYAYDQVVTANDNRLREVSYPGPTAPTIQYLYEDNAYSFALTGMIDEKGNRFATWAYDPYLRAISSQHADGADNTSLVYNLNGLGGGTVVATNALGRQTTYTLGYVAGVGKVTKIQEAASANAPATTLSLSYDPKGYIASRTDENGVRTNFTNDTRGLVLSKTEAVSTALARTTTFTWDATFHLPTQIVEPGRQTDFTYDASGRMLSRTVSDTSSGRSRSWAYTYTATGLPATIDGPRTDVADITTYTYNSTGTLASVTDALGHVTQVTSHDASGRPLMLLDANNVATTLAYDDRGRLLSTSVATGLGNVVTSFTYDSAGLVSALTLANGLSLSYGYDSAQRLTSVSNQLGERIDYTLDALGNVTHQEVKSTSGSIVATHEQAFDEIGQMIRSIGAAGQITSLGYDAVGNAVSLTDPLSHTTQHAYDGLRRLITMTDAANGVGGYGYDARNKLVSATDQRNLVTTYSRDAFGDVVSQTSPDSGTTSFETDIAGNVIRRTDARGVVSTYSYDALNRPLSRSYLAAPSELVAFGWDDNSNGNKGIGRLTSVSDGSGSTALVYDELGHVLSETRTAYGVTSTTGYVWTSAGDLGAVIYPSGRIVTYQRDGLGRISAITTKADGAAPAVTVISDVAWSALGVPSGWHHGNGLVRLESFDLDGRASAITTLGPSASVQDVSYGRDGAGNISAITDNLTPTQSQSFGYDSLNRLIHAQGIYGSMDYSWDGVGNRLSRSIGGDTATALYAADSNRLLSVVSTSATRSCVYSPSGAMVGDDSGSGTVTTRGYDQADRLIALTRNGSPIATYAYDGLGRRVEKTLTGAASSHFTWTGKAELLAESSGGAPVVEIIRFEGLPVAMVSQGNLYHLHTDHLGTPVAATDDAATVVWRRAWRPFGEDAGTSGSLTLNLRFPGQWLDAESGTNYNVMRDYDPSLGRYIQSDPIGLAGGWNTYAYVQGNPLSYVDQMGLADIPDAVPPEIPGGPYSPAGPGQPPGTFYGPKQPVGPKTECRWVPPAGEGGPPGSQGYWKAKTPGQSGWDRFNQSGYPITPEEAHPNRPLPPQPIPFIPYGLPAGAFLGTMFYSGPAY